MAATLLVALTAGLLVGMDDKAKDTQPKKDPDAVLGKWVVESVETGGEKRPGGDGMAITFKKDQYSVHMGENEIEQGTYKLDADKKPKTIDFMITKGADMGKKQYGIYTLEGDTLKICVTLPEKDDRPKEMASKQGSDHILFTMKREKK